MDMKKPTRKPDHDNHADPSDNKTVHEKKDEALTFTLSKRTLCIIIVAAIAAVVVLVLLFAVIPNIQTTPQEEEKPQATIVDFTAEDMDVSGVDLTGQVIILDAGHGGEDSGSIAAANNKLEKEINLEVAEKVKANLEKEGATVVMTRTTDDALGATKEEDFVAREDIIKKTNADMFISIHMNEYEEEGASGPQVFFVKQGAVGKRLATSIQDMLNYTLELEDPRMALPAEYRILKTGAQPSCTVEFGFLSNPEEGALLQTTEYQQQLADCVADGVKLYVKRYADLIVEEKEAAAAKPSPTVSAASTISATPSAAASTKQ